MKVQYLCHLRPISIALGLLCAFATVCRSDEPARADLPLHAYPTIARVEYVNACIAKAGGTLAALYQCSCAIDRIANTLTYDEFVEASTFDKYAALPGQAGSIFRDSDSGRKMAKSFRELQASSLRSCGVTH